MIPKWKLKRELLRIWYRILGFPALILSLPGRLNHRRRLAAHDRDFDQIVRTQNGSVERSDKVAIFLLYQPTGVAASVFLTLDYLIRNGYAPLIVMNSPILPEDAERLRKASWLIVTRPNFGYDFGGYRDGLRIMKGTGDTPHRLIIMNDSIWFPMQGDPIPVLEARLNECGLDAVGLNQDQKARYQKDGSLHYESRQLDSYFFLLSSACVESTAFSTFWTNYRMSSNKAYTIKHGEIGFSMHMMRQGARFEGALLRSKFIEAIQSCNAQFLRTTLEYASYADEWLRKERDSLLASFAADEAWRGGALAHIQKSALRRPFNTSFCYAADQLFGTVYLKKNSQNFFHQMRCNYLRAIENGLIAPPAPEIMTELIRMIETHNPNAAERTL